MTQAEQFEKLKSINERMLELQQIMRDSDAHASKCSKLGISFRDTYPTEYQQYTDARDEYNECETEHQQLLNVETEEVMPTEQ